MNPTGPLGPSISLSNLNKIRVIRAIRNGEGISRAEIARGTGLSAPTVSRIVDDLLRQEMVVETGPAPSHGGRRPTLLRFRGANHAIIGIDLGTTAIHGVLTDLDARIIAERSAPTRVGDGFVPVMERTAEMIADLKGALTPRGDGILGIGMAVSGLVNNRRNILEYSADFHWADADVAGEIGRWHPEALLFDNVNRVMAIGELHYGAGRKRRNFVCVNVGYGIGAGVVVDGRPLYGKTGMAGEFGHIPMSWPADMACDCGRINCLEALSSGNAIAKMARSALRAGGGDSALHRLCGGDLDTVDARMVAEAARDGDSLASGIFGRSLETLGLAIAGLVNVFSPEAVVIGGGVSRAGDVFFDTIRRVVRERALPNIARDVEILPAAFGPRAAVMGAVSLILNAVLSFSLSGARNGGGEPARGPESR